MGRQNRECISGTKEKKRAATRLFQKENDSNRDGLAASTLSAENDRNHHSPSRM